MVADREQDAASDLVEARRAIYEWADGDPLLLSARCAKAEQRIQDIAARLREIELTSRVEYDTDDRAFEALKSMIYMVRRDCRV